MSLTAIHPHSLLTTDDPNIGLPPMPSELTVAQAAQLIGAKEGLINDLIKIGRIAARLENGERLIDRDHLLDYVEYRARRNASLNEMVRMNQEMGLYDD